MVSKRKQAGFTFIELIVVVVIISVLAAVSIPMVKTSVQREKEIQLRRSLRLIRTALDEFKEFVEKNRIKVDEESYGYPETLEDLVEGIEYRDRKNNKRIKKFLRKIPSDPITNSFQWGLRSYQDDRDSEEWGGENVWDIYSKSEKKALNGSYYKEW